MAVQVIAKLQESVGSSKHLIQGDQVMADKLGLQHTGFTGTTACTIDCTSSYAQRKCWCQCNYHDKASSKKAHSC